MAKIASKLGATLKERICSHREQILSFKSSPYGKEEKHFMLLPLYRKYFFTHVTHMRNMRNERYVYGQRLASAISDQGLYFLFAKSLETVEFFDQFESP